MEPKTFRDLIEINSQLMTYHQLARQIEKSGRRGSVIWAVYVYSLLCAIYACDRPWIENENYPVENIRMEWADVPEGFPYDLDLVTKILIQEKLQTVEKL